MLFRGRDRYTLLAFKLLFVDMSIKSEIILVWLGGGANNESKKKNLLKTQKIFDKVFGGLQIILQ